MLTKCLKNTILIVFSDEYTEKSYNYLNQIKVGKAMTKMDCSIIDFTVNNFEIVKSGEPVIGQVDYLKAKQSLKNRNVDIVIDFKQGTEKIRVWTCDYSYDYVKINAHYTT